MIVATTVVRDEADVIETTIRHTLAEGVDHIIIGDNRSTDDTPTILKALKAEGLPLTIHQEADPGHHQGARMTRYAEQARQMGADWVLPFDADEYWYSDLGTLAEALAICPPELGVLGCAGYDHIARDDSGAPSPWRRPHNQQIPKVVFRAAEGVKVHEGNHGVDHPQAQGMGPVAFRHFQYRSLEHMTRKVREGAKACLAAGHNLDMSAHWHEAAALTDIELQARWLMLCCEQGLVFDPPPIRGTGTVAVVVPTLGPSPMLESCERAVKETAPEAELVVEHDEDRTGFAATCNRAAARTDADVLVFLNDDTVVQPGWLGALTRRTGWGVVGGHLMYPNGATQHAGVFLRRSQGVLEAFNRLQAPESSGEVPAVTGACLAVRRDVWDTLGGFDEAFRNGYEDVDLCLRAREAGHRVFLAADCRVVHLESQSPPELRFGHARENIALLQERWGHLSI